MNKYQEGNTVYKISLLEYELLKYYFHKGYKYIARNNDESLFIYRNKPQRMLMDIVQLILRVYFHSLNGKMKNLLILKNC